MKYLTGDMSKLWAIDIEGDDLPSTKIWCLCAVNIKSGEEVSLTDNEDIKRWVSDRLKDKHSFIAHNGIGYDFPTLNRLLGTTITMSNALDTMILSMLYSPSLDGGHSLS